MTAMQFQTTHLTALRSENDQVLAQNTDSLGQILKVFGERDRLPITAQQLTHRRSGLNVSRLTSSFGTTLP